MAYEAVTDRPLTYDPELIWSWDTLDWTNNLELLIVKGGRYHNKIIAISKDGDIYLKEV
jgi:hypothetical protein